LAFPIRGKPNHKPLILSLSRELGAILKKKFRTNGPVFDGEFSARVKAYFKIGIGKKTGPEWYQYKDLTPHDFRRYAVKTTGHRALSVFQRYNIVSTEQPDAVVAKVSDNARTTQKVVRTSRK
jgi:integrase